jgi:hypothetical protein
MIMVMENAALNAIRAYLDPGESAVGTAVNVRHLAATPVGRLVTGEAEVTKVDGRQTSSPSEQLRVPRRSGPARIPGWSSTWPSSRGGSNEQRFARLQWQFPAVGNQDIDGNPGVHEVLRDDGPVAPENASISQRIATPPRDESG